MFIYSIWVVLKVCFHQAVALVWVICEPLLTCSCLSSLSAVRFSIHMLYHQALLFLNKQYTVILMADFACSDKTSSMQVLIGMYSVCMPEDNFFWMCLSYYLS